MVGEEREREIERGSSQSADSGDARKADCLFVGSFWCCAHKQVETNNILAALRERVDGEGGGEGCPRAAVTRRTSAVEPLPSLMPASGPRVPLSPLPSLPPSSSSPLFYTLLCSLYPYRFVSIGIYRRGRIGSPFLRSYFEEGKRREGETCVNRVFQSAGNRNWKLKNVRSMLDGSWLLCADGVGRRVARDRLEGGGRGGGELESPVS